MYNFSTYKKIIFSLTIIISLGAFIFFFYQGITMFYGDSSSRLNIARKIIDNLTPGIGQLGTIWLPLPHILSLPFVWSDFLWHTGLAGSIISMLAFILAAFFIFKSIFDVTKDLFSSIITWLLFVTNLNILYMQTTAMSEMFFIMTVTGIIYFLIQWYKTDKITDLISAAFFVSLCTLTRYEGYFVFLTTIISVFIILMSKRGRYKNIEGKLIIFITLAITGILTWSLYQFLIFKDPIYWLKIYTGHASIISTEANRLTDTAQGVKISMNFIQAVIHYFNASALMNGIIVSYSAILLLIITIGHSIFKKNKSILIILGATLLIPVGAFIFTAYAVKGGFPLDIPKLSFNALFDNRNNDFQEYNIRYGLNFIPFILISLGIFSSINKYSKGLISLLLLVQISGYLLSSSFFIFNIPKYFLSKPLETHYENKPSFVWFRNNYDQGLILISALKHDPEMFYMGIDYNTYIHEGTQEYWLESIASPQKYATWIYMQKPKPIGGIEEDSVSKNIKEIPNISDTYNTVYDDEQIIIYKIKTQPEIQIPIE